MADTLVKKPVLFVGTKEQINAATMGENDFAIVTDEEFYTSKQIDELLSKAGGASLPILTRMWSDHVINDMSWLRADTFSWQSGDVYKAAYEHLANEYQATPPEYYAWHWNEFSITVYTKSRTPKVGDIVYYTEDYMNFSERSTVVKVEGEYIYIEFNDSSAYRLPGDDVGGTRLQNDTIDDIEIQYYTAEDGHKICLPDQESNVVALYEKTGAADYYLLDTTNKQFKLPRKQKRTLIQAVKNTDGTWYNLYSDGWVEQGGSDFTARTINAGAGTAWYVTMPVPMSDTNYNIQISFDNGNLVPAVNNNKQTTTTQVYLGCKNQNTASVTSQVQYWQVSGYAAESAYASAGMRLEYYYVGNFEQTAVEQTAGLNAELFNGKADVDLNNINPSNSAKAMIVGWGMPDYDSGVSISTSIGGTFTVPTDCCIYGSAGSNSRIGVYKDSSSGVRLLYLESTGSDTATDHVFVAKGTKLYVAYRNGSCATLIYYPLKGAN